MIRTVRRLQGAKYTLAVGGVLGVLAFLWFQPPFLSYENLPFPPQLQQVRAGQIVPLTVRRCSTASETRAYDITHTIERLDKPAQPLILPSLRVTVDPGCVTSVSEINQVPHGAEPGTYRVTGLAIVETALRTQAVPWHSQPFEVTR